jgi:hypothetical protein
LISTISVLTQNLALTREIPARDRQSRRLDPALASSSLLLPPSHPLCRRLCSKRLNPPQQRIPHHRLRVPAAVNRATLVRRERRGPVPCHLNAPKLGSQQREEQDGDRRGRRCGADQAACLASAIAGTERDDRLRGCPSTKW